MESTGGRLFVDDAALLASGYGSLQLTVKQFAAEFQAAGIRISITKSAHYRSSVSLLLTDEPVCCVDELSTQAKLFFYWSIYILIYISPVVTRFG